MCKICSIHNPLYSYSKCWNSCMNYFYVLISFISSTILPSFLFYLLSLNKDLLSQFLSLTISLFLSLSLNLSSPLHWYLLHRTVLTSKHLDQATPTGEKEVEKEVEIEIEKDWRSMDRRDGKEEVKKEKKQEEAGDEWRREEI